MNNQDLIINFINDFWNKQSFANATIYLCDDYRDFSLPKSLGNDVKATIKWIEMTSEAFSHFTHIEDVLADKNRAMVKVKLQLRHIGLWRGIESTGTSLTVNGFRYFKINDGKIAEHWGLIDGNAIEAQLTAIQNGCAV
ncbi:hypothetical protein BCY91_16275 [Pelobium manganitolerans]|uniref:Ester cyclase n=1 Tax=Pelobium manganitolerans TaxID=1842495 RepID=A0A419S8B7_9SPHI|nr:ester cyclase [Pelobium manganitolerans]RKD17999.1 hypothetical protein BCY91_16275 [Pelobium manganitolerans]